jgi:uncharacterized coiled-coil DUF342 family protein
MARIVALSIALAAIIAAGVLSYLSHDKIVGLNGQIADLNTTLASTRQDLARAQANLKSTQEELTQTKKDLDDTKAQLVTTQGSLDAANAQVASLTDKASELQKQLDNLKLSTPTGITTTGPTQADYDKVVAELKDATTHVNELTTIENGLTKELKDSQAHADDLQKTVDHYKDHIIANGLEGEVLAYNPNWNFVVLSIGDHAGAVTNSELILKRGGAQIGKVRITSVEPSTSVADIVPGSLARGVKVQPGDRVIYTGGE